jgi:hypothetical protein
LAHDRDRLSGSQKSKTSTVARIGGPTMLLTTLLLLSVAASCQQQDALTGIQLAELKRSVVRVLAYDSRDSLLGTATGFYVADSKSDPILGETWPGRVVTNEHVVSRGARFAVELMDGTTVEARVRLRDPDSDLAILSATFIPAEGDTVQTSRRKPLTIEVSREPREGERVWTIGSPMALGWIVADGIISARRDIAIGQSRVQHTVPISPGSSGSPLLDFKGRVVGVMCSGVREAENVGFAIPASRVLQCLLLSEAPTETSTTSRHASGPRPGVTASDWWRASLRKIEAVLAIDSLNRLAQSKKSAVLRLLALAQWRETADENLAFLRASKAYLDAQTAAARALRINPNIPGTHRDLAVACMAIGDDSVSIWENRVALLMLGLYEGEERSHSHGYRRLAA